MRPLKFFSKRILTGFGEWKIPQLSFDDNGDPKLWEFIANKEIWLPSMKAMKLKNDLEQLIGQKIKIHFVPFHSSDFVFDSFVEAELLHVYVDHEYLEGHGRLYNQLYLILSKPIWEYFKPTGAVKLEKDKIHPYALKASHIDQLTYYKR